MGGKDEDHSKLINIMEEAGVEADDYILFIIVKPK